MFTLLEVEILTETFQQVEHRDKIIISIHNFPQSYPNAQRVCRYFIIHVYYNQRIDSPSVNLI